MALKRQPLGSLREEFLIPGRKFVPSRNWRGKAGDEEIPFVVYCHHNLSLQLAYQPHLVDVNQVPDRFQMELIELSEDSILKSLFNAKKDPIEIWKSAVEYPRLHQHARQMPSCFGTAYRCESAFSYMTQIKNRLRSQITNVHLEDHGGRPWSPRSWATPRAWIRGRRETESRQRVSGAKSP